MFDEKIADALDRLKNAICQMREEIVGCFQELSELLALADEEYPEEREPVEKTPYFFRSKPRIFDKRPHKQHRVRNNCRKEWKKVICDGN